MASIRSTQCDIRPQRVSPRPQRCASRRALEPARGIRRERVAALARMPLRSTVPEPGRSGLHVDAQPSGFATGGVLTVHQRGLSLFEFESPRPFEHRTDLLEPRCRHRPCATVPAAPEQAMTRQTAPQHLDRGRAHQQAGQSRNRHREQRAHRSRVSSRGTRQRSRSAEAGIEVLRRSSDAAGARAAGLVRGAVGWMRDGACATDAVKPDRAVSGPGRPDPTDAAMS